jgi:ABC-type Fe3+-siderophore transport system permease subunit
MALLGGAAMMGIADLLSRTMLAPTRSRSAW